jgi:hypothetical protein
MSRTTTEIVNSDLEVEQPEQVSSGSLIFLPGVGEIAQLHCRLYSELPSLFRPVTQLEDAYMSLRDKNNLFTHQFLAVSLKE